MGKSNIILLSGFSLYDNNRGSSALGYGSISFLREKGYVEEGDKFYMLSRVDKKVWRKSNFQTKVKLKVNGQDVDIYVAKYFSFEYKLYLKYGICLPFSPLKKVVDNLKLVAATNGGDGFSDIYGKAIFLNRLKESWMAIREHKQLLVMPQTLGPFKDNNIRQIADQVLRNANKIYVRDNRFETELNNMGLNFEVEKDLSSYMLPETWDIDILPNSIGINVSGLAYSNKFKTLAGQFGAYPELIDSLITHFQKLGHHIYLIPHSYNFNKPEKNNDDLEACLLAYNRLSSKSGVEVICKNLTAPQVKYVISKMIFFCGTRMHANFAAIYTHVPVFGLAYSYKFAGAFEANGLSAEQTCMINNISMNDIQDIISKINNLYSNNKTV